MADLYVCPARDCGRTYPDADAFNRHVDIAVHTSDEAYRNAHLAVEQLGISDEEMDEWWSR